MDTIKHEPERSDCCSRHAGVQALAEPLSSGGKLVSLTLEDNCLGHGGAVALGGLLARSTMLTSLRVLRNEIGGHGTAAICDGAAGLRALSIHHDELGAHGAEALATVLRADGCALAELTLQRAGLGPGGVFGLAAGLAENTSLTSLDVSASQPMQ